MHADTRPQTPPRRSFPLPLVRAQTVKLQEQKDVCVLGWGGGGEGVGAVGGRGQGEKLPRGHPPRALT